MASKSIYLDGELFLGRLREQDDFARTLKRLRVGAESHPSVFLLYGEGGMGKTWLVQRFQEIAIRDSVGEGVFQVLLINWEVEQSHNVDLNMPFRVEPEIVLETFAVISERVCKCRFKGFREVVVRRDKARKKVGEELNRDRNNERWAGRLEMIVPAKLRIPGVGPLPEGSGTVIKNLMTLGRDWVQERVRLNEEERRVLIQPLDELARALGRGLAQVADSRPLVVLLDNYEIVERADPWLRLAIETAGPRVVWVIAGRNNLRDSRSLDHFVGYSARFPRGLFAYDMQELAVADVHDYLLYRAPDRPANEQDAERIQKATFGIPLVLRLVGDLWERGMPIETLEEGGPQREEIVRVMSERVLIHCHERDRRALYLLAMQRRPHLDTQRAALALGEGELDLSAYWTELAARYSAVLRGRKVTLNERIAGFVREYLVSRCQEFEVLRDLATRAENAVSGALDELEASRQRIESRCMDEDWQELLGRSYPLAALEELRPSTARIATSICRRSRLQLQFGSATPCYSSDLRPGVQPRGEEATQGAPASARGGRRRS